MKVSRRTFVKGSAATIGGLAASQYLGGLELLVPRGAEAASDEWKNTTCWIGKQDCGVRCRVINGRMVKIEGHPDHPRNRGKLCPKGVGQIISIYDYNRVKTPLIRTNTEKGVPGEWRQASWDEALTLAGNKIAEAKAKTDADPDPNHKYLVWQKGRSKSGDFYDNAFVKASGAEKLHHGALCSDAAYRANEYTVGIHGVWHGDYRYTKYLLTWGWNITNSGGNKLCWITWPRQLLEAKERGMKVVVIDPRARNVGPFVDEWLPVKPTTDMALALAMSNVLVEAGYIDEYYLKNHTNSPFLVKSDGYFYKVGGKEQVWDTKTNSAKAYDAAGVTPALEAPSTTAYKTAFTLFKENVAKYSPETVAGICGIPADKIRKIAMELGDAAQIGSTKVVDGIELPYRPVAVAAYHVSQQELGFQASRAIISMMMLLGAIEAVGGQRIDFKFGVHGNFKGLDEATVNDPPYNIYLGGSKFWPINSNNSSIVAHALLNQAKYGVDYTPEVLILHMSNIAISHPDQKAIWDYHKLYKFVVVLDPWLSETADYFADVILPAATIEKYEGPSGVTDQYEDAVTLRLPPMDPLFDSKGDIQIYLDLSEKAGILYGAGGYIDQINKRLGTSVPTNTKPEVRDIFDAWAKVQGLSGVDYFETNGVLLKGKVAAADYYGSAQDYGGIRHRLYGESLLRIQEEMKAKGADEVYWQDYVPLPVWRPATLDSSPSQYNLYLISYKKIEFKQSRGFGVLDRELAPEQFLDINPEAAQARGINDGDEVTVESHNALTLETRSVTLKARYVNGIRPDTVAMAHHYGGWTHPWQRNGKGGPTPNTLFHTVEGYVSIDGSASFQIKVKVSK